jgi:hypothetical protein
VNLVANCTEFDYIVNFVVNILAYSIACARCRQGFRPTELTCAPTPIDGEKDLAPCRDFRV